MKIPNDHPMDARHMQLVRDISEAASLTAREFGINPLELVACIGVAAGAFISSCTDPAIREQARGSVISSMDRAIDDFMRGRGMR